MSGEVAGFLDSKKDFTAEVQSAIPESVKIADEKGLTEAISFLLLVEKKCRVYNDFSNLKEVCLHMVRLCHSKKDWEKINSTLMVINKRRAQSKVAISAIVEEAMKYIDETPSEEYRVNLITTLKDICEGKMYVEGESAKLHLMLAQILEAKGDIGGACDMIQDVHVETYGSLDKKEKAAYILHQIRLNLKRKDFIRAMIQSRKMNRKVLEETGFDEIKVSFYRMMIEHHTHDHDCWEICQSYYKIYDTPATQLDETAKYQALESSIVFLLLSAYNNHQQDLLHRIHRLKDLESSEMTVFKEIVNLFIKKEIIGTPFVNQNIFENHVCLSAVNGVEDQKYYVDIFHTRIIEHNLRVASSYYKRIRCQRLIELLNLPSLDILEKHLGDLSISGDAYVKIDRPAGIVSFRSPRQPAEVLSDWSSDIGKLLSLMETTCHLINRETMVYKV